MRDVVRRAGVSLVVNGTGYVSDRLRERVERAMRELDYVPNDLARHLSQGSTGLVGVIVPTVMHPFFATLTAALQRDLSARGVAIPGDLQVVAVGGTMVTSTAGLPLTAIRQGRRPRRVCDGTRRRPPHRGRCHPRAPGPGPDHA
ncbi:LacI-type transcriptional regulator [Bifidobacterium cuniculi]|uniref:LacI-type transcriptional regulator n=1 Tax=Bifidobacterium cuniculi TaxID=1688 RepID=A0A087B3B3_9BIFI|nr:LacI-type transcriptional regulator [Bifidobacterium cuniculi]